MAMTKYAVEPATLTKEATVGVDEQEAASVAAPERKPTPKETPSVKKKEKKKRD